MHAICLPCGKAMRFPKAGVLAVHFDDSGDPDAIWRADLKRCPDCGFEILEGFGSRQHKYPDNDRFNAQIETARENGTLYEFDGSY